MCLLSHGLISHIVKRKRRSKIAPSKGKEESRHDSQQGHFWGSFGAQAGSCFQVLTKAVGMSEYGTVVMLFQASSAGS